MLAKVIRQPGKVRGKKHYICSSETDDIPLFQIEIDPLFTPFLICYSFIHSFIYIYYLHTLRSLIRGEARLFIFKNLSSISIDFHVVKYFFHPTRLFIYYIHKKAGIYYPTTRLLDSTLIFDTPE